MKCRSSRRRARHAGRIEEGVSRSKASAAHPSEIDLPGDRITPSLTLAEPLAYCYKRDTVTIYGNVAKATHGETRVEVLGSGDASQPLPGVHAQAAAADLSSRRRRRGRREHAAGARQRRALARGRRALAGLDPPTGSFITRTGRRRQDHRHLRRRRARAPAAHRAGERARASTATASASRATSTPGRSACCATRPLGVKGVINPLPATGGADPESRDQARRNAPLAVMALDRLVSVAGLRRLRPHLRRHRQGQRGAAVGRPAPGRPRHHRRRGRHPDRRRLRSLPQPAPALHRFGDPAPAAAGWTLRELLLLVVSAEVRAAAGLPLGQRSSRRSAAACWTRSASSAAIWARTPCLSEVIAAIQAVPGVDYVDVDVFGAGPREAVQPVSVRMSGRRTRREHVLRAAAPRRGCWSRLSSGSPARRQHPAGAARLSHPRCAGHPDPEGAANHEPPHSGGTASTTCCRPSTACATPSRAIRCAPCCR